MHVEAGGLTIAFERAGTGPALALAHGFVGDARSTWGSQIEALSDEFSVLAWDAPGAGGSDDPPEDFGMDAYADCLAGLLRALRIERATWLDSPSAGLWCSRRFIGTPGSHPHSPW